MKTADIEKKIRQLAQSINGKVEHWKIDFAIEYIDHGENRIAFETLCEYICEVDANINLEDFKLISSISHSGIELDPLLLIYLAKLVRDAPDSPPA
jgi:hypothetical protein